jgi:hypothetical protein
MGNTSAIEMGVMSIISIMEKAAKHIEWIYEFLIFMSLTANLAKS